jgi:hypothetical protein
MDVVVGDALAGSNAVVLEDVQAGGVESLRDRPCQPVDVARDRRCFLGAEVEHGCGMAPQDDEKVAEPELTRIDEGQRLLEHLDDSAPARVGHIAAEGASLVQWELEGHSGSIRSNK